MDRFLQLQIKALPTKLMIMIAVLLQLHPCRAQDLELKHYFDNQSDTDFILHLQDIVPQLQESAVENGTNMMTVIHQQRVVRQKLEASEEFQKLNAERQEPVRIKVKPEAQEGPVLTLQEVPTYIGLFRGLVGHDCSTSCSAYYANDPMEKVFFIYSGKKAKLVLDKKELIGFAAGTVVHVGGVRSLYLHTISGRQIGEEHLPLILEGLRRQSASLGVSKLALPVEKKSQELLNYRVIKEFIGHLGAGQVIRPVEYIAKDSRQIIDDNLLAKVDYDKAASNTEAFFYEENLLSPAHKMQLTTDANSFYMAHVYQSLMEERSTRHGDIVSLAMDSFALGDLYGGYTLISNWGLDRLAFLQLIEDKANKKRLDLKSYYSLMEKELKALDPSFNASFFKERKSLFMEGVFRAPDCLADGHRKGTLHGALSYIHNHGVDPLGPALLFMKEQKDFLNHDKHFLLTVKDFLLDKKEDNPYHQWKLKQGENIIKGQVLDHDNSLEILRTLTEEKGPIGPLKQQVLLGLVNGLDFNSPGAALAEASYHHLLKTAGKDMHGTLIGSLADLKAGEQVPTWANHPHRLEKLVSVAHDSLLPQMTSFLSHPQFQGQEFDHLRQAMAYPTLQERTEFLLGRSYASAAGDEKGSCDLSPQLP